MAAIVGNSEVECQHVDEIFCEARPSGRGDTLSVCWVESLANTVKQFIALDYGWIVDLGILDQVCDQPRRTGQLLKDYEIKGDYETDEDEGVECPFQKISAKTHSDRLERR
jgi:hypothetical protein